MQHSPESPSTPESNEQYRSRGKLGGPTAIDACDSEIVVSSIAKALVQSDAIIATACPRGLATDSCSAIRADDATCMRNASLQQSITHGVARGSLQVSLWHLAT